MYKIAHISDIHLPLMPSPSFSQLFSKRITGFLNWKLNRAKHHGSEYLDCLMAGLKSESLDHLIVSGDLTNLALPEEIENAREFLEALGLPENITAQLGNHDAYIRGTLEEALAKWHPYLAGDQDETLSPSSFPTLRTRKELAIIACNSAEPTPPFMATGYFREDQATRLGEILDETRNRFRIVSIHHPPFIGATKSHKRLIGRELFERTIQIHGAELILHGHTHLSTVRSIQTPHGQTPIICVPAAGNGHGRNRPAGRYHLFHIQKNRDAWEIQLEAIACSPDLTATECVHRQNFLVKQCFAPV